MKKSSTNLGLSTGSPKLSPRRSKRVKRDSADKFTENKLEIPVSTEDEEQNVDDDLDADFVVDGENELEEDDALSDLESEAIAAALSDDEEDSIGTDDDEGVDWNDPVDISSGE